MKKKLLLAGIFLLTVALAVSAFAAGENPATTKSSVPGPQYTGQKVSLDFQEANIKSVFRLLSEVSGVNVVSGEDVKKNITVHMKNVNWDQALDTILDTNGLGSKRTGNVISVFTLEKMKKAVEERLKEDVKQGKKPQVFIEAKIMEATASFARKLGVQWGVGTETGNVWLGSSARMLPTGLTPLTTSLGVFGGNYGVNLGAFTTAASPSLGMILGTTKNFLDVQISALEGMGEVKIISSPKVVTFDNTPAYISQGSEIPYTLLDKEGNKTIQWKEAVLRLDVTPSITSDNKIVVTIKAKNDAPDYATKSAQNLDNPPINKSEFSSTVIVRDGDTIVVGGIRKSTDSKQENGVPGLKDVPILGWLFKQEDILKEQKELLIFITPRVVKEDHRS
jgi:type IV pilus assembly protein PilQ